MLYPVPELLEECLRNILQFIIGAILLNLWWLISNTGQFATIRKLITLLEAEFKTNTLQLSDGTEIPFKLIFEQHIQEDCENVVSLMHWLVNYSYPKLKSGSACRLEKKWGGCATDYDPIIALFEFHHPLQLHHSHGIFQIESILGMTLTNSTGRVVPVRILCEEYLRARYQQIPTPEMWLKGIRYQPWMLRTAKIENNYL
ncbi:MAG: hypothetical protein IPJ20_19600 [Flammeovirgaceae bacterium]|nr:hypothetical protein [Flammeovirgaceae bacterium]